MVLESWLGTVLPGILQGHFDKLRTRIRTSNQTNRIPPRHTHGLVSSLGYSDSGFVSDFVLRISDFKAGRTVRASRDRKLEPYAAATRLGRRARRAIARCCFSTAAWMEAMYSSVEWSEK